MQSSFLFAVCQLDVERELKREVARVHPGLRGAFQRPGLVTFKSDAPLGLDFRFEAVIARAYGLSLGRAADVGEAARALAAILPGERAHLHVFPRDTTKPGECDETVRAAGLDRADDVRATLIASSGERFFEARHPVDGELVLDVLLGDPEEPLLLGAHRHHPGHSRRPGGRLDVVLPESAPSRAYLKLLDGFDFAEEELLPGRVAVEIGSAPGGAVWAMLERGLVVYGVDPGAMDPRIEAIGRESPERFHHLSMPVGAVRDELLSPRVDYLLLDANLAPQVAFRSAVRLAAMRKSTLRAMILTLKMNDWRYLENLAAFTERARELGFDDIRARHLATNRQEVCFVARRRLRRA